MNGKNIFLLALLAVVSFQLTLHTEDTPVSTARKATPAANSWTTNAPDKKLISYKVNQSQNASLLKEKSEKMCIWSDGDCNLVLVFLLDSEDNKKTNHLR